MLPSRNKCVFPHNTLKAPHGGCKANVAHPNQDIHEKLCHAKVSDFCQSQIMHGNDLGI